MPLHTYAYACGCRRHVQGRQCECFLNEILSINDPSAFAASKANYLPFNMDSFQPRHTARPSGFPQMINSYNSNVYSSCRRHDRKYRSRYDCPDHIYRRQKSLYETHWEALRLKEYKYRRRHGRELPGFKYGVW